MEARRTTVYRQCARIAMISSWRGPSPPGATRWSGITARRTRGAPSALPRRCGPGPAMSVRHRGPMTGVHRRPGRPAWWAPRSRSGRPSIRAGRGAPRSIATFVRGRRPWKRPVCARAPANAQSPLGSGSLRPSGCGRPARGWPRSLPCWTSRRRQRRGTFARTRVGAVPNRSWAAPRSASRALRARATRGDGATRSCSTPSRNGSRSKVDRHVRRTGGPRRRGGPRGGGTASFPGGRRRARHGS